MFGQGIYDISDAARLLRKPADQVRRWANGYTYTRTYDVAHKKPILQTERESKRLITFDELIELMYVREFYSMGVPISTIRLVAERLSAEHGPHPFAQKLLYATGKDLVFDEGDLRISASTLQIVGDWAVPFSERVEIDKGKFTLWRPEEGENVVVVDPTKMTGQPIVEETGTPTKVLYNLYRCEQSFDVVAEYYDLPLELVKKAIVFERHFTSVA